MSIKYVHKKASWSLTAQKTMRDLLSSIYHKWRLSWMINLSQRLKLQRHSTTPADEKAVHVGTVVTKCMNLFTSQWQEIKKNLNKKCHSVLKVSDSAVICAWCLSGQCAHHLKVKCTLTKKCCQRQWLTSHHNI